MQALKNAAKRGMAMAGFGGSIPNFKLSPFQASNFLILASVNDNFKTDDPSSPLSLYLSATVKKEVFAADTTTGVYTHPLVEAYVSASQTTDPSGFVTWAVTAVKGSNFQLFPSDPAKLSNELLYANVGPLLKYIGFSSDPKSRTSAVDPVAEKQQVIERSKRVVDWLGKYSIPQPHLEKYNEILGKFEKDLDIEGLERAHLSAPSTPPVKTPPGSEPSSPSLRPTVLPPSSTPSSSPGTRPPGIPADWKEFNEPGYTPEWVSLAEYMAMQQLLSEKKTLVADKKDTQEKLNACMKKDAITKTAIKNILMTNIADKKNAGTLILAINNEIATQEKANKAKNASSSTGPVSSSISSSSSSPSSSSKYASYASYTRPRVQAFHNLLKT